MTRARTGRITKQVPPMHLFTRRTQTLSKHSPSTEEEEDDMVCINLIILKLTAYGSVLTCRPLVQVDI